MFTLLVISVVVNIILIVVIGFIKSLWGDSLIENQLLTSQNKILKISSGLKEAREQHEAFHIRMKELFKLEEVSIGEPKDPTQEIVGRIQALEEFLQIEYFTEESERVEGYRKIQNEQNEQKEI